MRTSTSLHRLVLQLGLTLFCLTINPVFAEVLMSSDFNVAVTDNSNAANALHGYSSTSSGDVKTTLAITANGTIDRYMGTPSQAITFTADFSAAADKQHARAAMVSAIVAVHNKEADLAKLTLAFDLKSTLMQPVRIVLTSYDQAGQATGSRSTTVVPPVANAFYRFTIDLDKTVARQGRFDPLAPKMGFSFELNGADSVMKTLIGVVHTLSIDNLSYTSPAYYVSAKGNDQADGRSAASAFASIQKAVDVSRAGDVVLVMEGTYTNTHLPDISHIPKSVVNGSVWRPWWPKTSGSVVNIDKVGTPAAWIVIRSHPGHHPRIFNVTGWNAFQIDLGAAYIELRDLTIQGNAAKLKLAEALADSDITERDGWRYFGDARFNGNGIMVDGRATQDPSQRAHHLRFIGNTVFDNPAAGIVAIGADYVTVAHNISYDNVHFTRWGASGISFLRTFNFDESTDHKMFVVGNQSFLNRCYVPWINYLSDAQGNPVANDKAPKHPLSDGNGIIVDVSRKRGIPGEGSMDRDYVGRTLVSNNLSYGNGGGGIVLTTVLHVDVINNTLYGNVQTPTLAERGWGDLFLGGPPPSSGDVTVINNIVYATNAKVALAVHPLTQPQPLLIKNNLFFGGAQPSDWPQIDNLSSDPLFVNPSLDPKKADFRLRVNSPAKRKGSNLPARLIPINDIERRLRTVTTTPTLGAYQ